MIENMENETCFVMCDTANFGLDPILFKYRASFAGTDTFNLNAAHSMKGREVCHDL